MSATSCIWRPRDADRADRLARLPGASGLLLCLGASVAASPDGARLDVEFPDGLLDEDESPGMYYETLARANRLDARITESSSATAPKDLSR
jgi:hypothetical protein